MNKSSTFARAIGMTLLVLALIFAVVTLPRPMPAVTSDDAVVHITLLQLNDVYEMQPVSGGTQGGLARVATLYKQLLEQNPNTFMLLAGDLFSPSALGTAKVDGEPLAGRHMVDVMNKIGLTFATFGNHEFDLDESGFLSRLEESEFMWISSNVFDAASQPFTGVVENHIFTVGAANNQSVRIGLFGLTRDSNEQPYVTYKDSVDVAQEQVNALRGEVDILIALTHLSISEDQKMLDAVSGIDLVLGGHEHENNQVWRGADFTPIFKADANARTAYVHDLYYNTDTRELEINSRLQFVTDAIADDPDALCVIDEWVELAFDGFRESGFEPKKVITEVPVALDGTEASVRTKSTALTDLIAKGFLNAAAGSELAIFNGGAIRIDDTIPPGDIDQYDVIRILPFGGLLLSVEMKGSLISMVLDQGQASSGAGGFLHTANVRRSDDSGSWLISGEAIDPERTYLVAINDFLVSGAQSGLEYLTKENPDLSIVSEHVDIRMALIMQLEVEYGAK